MYVPDLEACGKNTIIDSSLVIKQLGTTKLDSSVLHERIMGW